MSLTSKKIFYTAVTGVTVTDITVIGVTVIAVTDIAVTVTGSTSPCGNGNNRANERVQGRDAIHRVRSDDSRY